MFAVLTFKIKFSMERNKKQPAPKTAVINVRKCKLIWKEIKLHYRSLVFVSSEATMIKKQQCLRLSFRLFER